LYFLRFELLLLKNHPPILMEWPVVLYSSIQSGLPPCEWVSISLIITSPGLGSIPLSSRPGEPPQYALARQASLSPQLLTSGLAGFIIVREKPLPAVISGVIPKITCRRNKKIPVFMGVGNITQHELVKIRPAYDADGLRPGISQSRHEYRHQQ